MLTDRSLLIWLTPFHNWELRPRKITGHLMSRLFSLIYLLQKRVQSHFKPDRFLLLEAARIPVMKTWVAALVSLERPLSMD